MRFSLLSVVIGSCLTFVPATMSQSLRPIEQQSRPTAEIALKKVINIDMRQAPAQSVFTTIAQMGSLDLVADWKRIEQDGVDINQSITVTLRNVSVARALRIALMQISGDEPLMIESSRTYVQLLTRKQANANPVVKVYLIADLLHPVPQFNNAPKFDLSRISDSNNSNSLFNTDSSNDKQRLARTERGELIADLIRRTIEPNIWELNGGTAGRITYHSGRLVIRAPNYVHRRIGISETDMFLRRKAALRTQSIPRYVTHGAGGTYTSQTTTTDTGISISMGKDIAADIHHNQRTRRTTVQTSQWLRNNSTYRNSNPNSYYNRPSGSGVSGVSK